jgi:2-polyprenyl-3-methyl-5-hydroxy-6-metoxy-1,4-benzoquinol methylase
MDSKPELQENQYVFPYHHLAHEKSGGIYIFEHLFWGLVHYTYISYVIEKIVNTEFTTLADIGCGEGRIICELEKKNIQASFFGYDISKRAIRFAEAFSIKSKFSVHDIVKSPLLEPVDVIVSCEVIEHIEPHLVPRFVNNIFSSLKSGGTVIISTPTTNARLITKHYQHFTSEMFDKLLKGKSSDIKYEYLNKSNWYASVLNKLIANRFYISNSNLLNSFVLNSYKKRLLISDKENGDRIVVIAKKL